MSMQLSATAAAKTLAVVEAVVAPAGGTTRPGSLAADAHSPALAMSLLRKRHHVHLFLLRLVIAALLADGQHVVEVSKDPHRCCHAAKTKHLLRPLQKLARSRPRSVWLQRLFTVSACSQPG